MRCPMISGSTTKLSRARWSILLGAKSTSGARADPRRLTFSAILHGFGAARMGYHDLSECTLDDAERREEANRILAILAEEIDTPAGTDDDELSTVEREFLLRMRKGGPAK